MTMMHQHLAALLAAGYEVTFTQDDAGVACFIRLAPGGAGKDWLAIEDTPAKALWTASPLHGDDEPYPGDDLADGLTDDIIRAIRRNGYHAGVRDGHQQATDERVKALEANFHLLADAIRGRLDAIDKRVAAATVTEEALRAVWEEGRASAGVDSHVWYCAKCGGQCIGTEPANSVCRGCGGE